MFDSPHWHYVAVGIEGALFLAWAVTGYSYLLVILVGLLMLWRARSHWQAATRKHAEDEGGESAGITDRAQSTPLEIAGGLASVFGVGVFYLLFSAGWDPLKTEADAVTTNATAQQTVDWLGLGWDWFLAAALGIIVMGVIVGTHFQRQGGFR